MISDGYDMFVEVIRENLLLLSAMVIIIDAKENLRG